MCSHLFLTLLSHKHLSFKLLILDEECKTKLLNQDYKENHETIPTSQNLVECRGWGWNNDEQHLLAMWDLITF